MFVSDSVVIAMPASALDWEQLYSTSALLVTILVACYHPGVCSFLGTTKTIRSE
jgi:hypothetical protein